MMRKTGVAILSFITLLNASNCDKSAILPNEEIIGQYEFTDFPCTTANAGRELFGKQNASFLDSTVYENGVLHLYFGFGSVCGSAFKDSALVDNERLMLFLSDTSTTHARCPCDHNCEFALALQQKEKFDLTLSIKFYAQNTFTTCLDTMLIFQKNEPARSGKISANQNVGTTKVNRH